MTEDHPPLERTPPAPTTRVRLVTGPLAEIAEALSTDTISDVRADDGLLRADLASLAVAPPLDTAQRRACLVKLSARLVAGIERLDRIAAGARVSEAAA